MDYEIEITPNQYHPIDEVDKIIQNYMYPYSWIIVNTEPVTLDNYHSLRDNQKTIYKNLPVGKYIGVYEPFIRVDKNKHTFKLFGEPIRGINEHGFRLSDIDKYTGGIIYALRKVG